MPPRNQRGRPAISRTARARDGRAPAREVRTTGRPIAHVAKDLGIHKEALRGCVRQAEADHGERDDRLTTAERDELKQLRKENAELKRANEILKAASVFLPNHG
ncbi:transposase [Streptomyces sp. NPDC020298]|uniref:transposase n=1 Tax=unclassified Streptomyces TaxID=2593676 RepID=UPI0033F17980